ncbi:hypothetical protein [Desertivibrio insolitus]|uniref:hypothetical protein n=1 Tax=Herbiconiux sp. SYSU D00978 TaxID=2812562 RepID=UPI001A95C9DE|nr:hypothetical protein [Herbiconiux sp. SYSU D00978]
MNADNSGFREWLHTQQDRSDEIGAFAQKVLADPLFPEHGGRAIYDGYFETGFDDETRETYGRAYEEFENMPQMPQ